MIHCAGLRTRSGAWRLPVIDSAGLKGGTAGLGHIRVPPLPPGKCFIDVYEVVLLLDNREQFAHVSGVRKVQKPEAIEAHAESMRASGLVVILRTLPTGDIVWIARCHCHFPGGPAVGVF